MCEKGKPIVLQENQLWNENTETIALCFRITCENTISEDRNRALEEGIYIQFPFPVNRKLENTNRKYKPRSEDGHCLETSRFLG